MRAWHIYSYTWQDTPLFKSPNCPEWPKRGVKRCLVTFKCFLITEWGDGKLPAAGLGQNQVHHINQRRNSFLSYPPANAYIAAVDMWEEEKGKLLFYYSNNVWVINRRCDYGSDDDDDDDDDVWSTCSITNIPKLRRILYHASQLLEYLPVNRCGLRRYLKEVKYE